MNDRWSYTGIFIYEVKNGQTGFGPGLRNYSALAAEVCGLNQPLSHSLHFGTLIADKLNVNLLMSSDFHL